MDALGWCCATGLLIPEYGCSRGFATSRKRGCEHSPCWLPVAVHRWAQGVRGLTPLDPLNPPSPPTKTQGAKNCNRKNTLDPNLHNQFLTPGNHNVPRWKFSIQKCINRKIYTPFLTLGEPPWNFRKKFRRETLKRRFFEHRFWPPPPTSTPWGGGPTVPTYAIDYEVMRLWSRSVFGYAGLGCLNLYCLVYLGTLRNVI